MYTDGELDDDDIDGKRSYKIEDKIENNKCNKDYVRKLRGEGIHKLLGTEKNVHQKKKQFFYIFMVMFCFNNTK